MIISSTNVVHNITLRRMSSAMRHGWLTIHSMALGGISIVRVIVVVKVGGVTVVTAVNRMATAETDDGEYTGYFAFIAEESAG
jgi:hypothetical protein